MTTPTKRKSLYPETPLEGVLRLLDEGFARREAREAREEAEKARQDASTRAMVEYEVREVNG